MIHIIEDLLMTLLSAVLVVEYYSTFFQKKAIKYINCIVWVSFYVVQMILNNFSEYITAVGRLVISVGIIIVFGMLFDGNILGKIVFSFLYIALWMLGESLTAAVFLLLNIDIDSHMLLGSVISKIFLLFVIKVLQRFFHQPIVFELPWYMNMVFMLLPVGSMYILHYLFMAEYRFHNEDYKQPTMILFIIVLAVNVIMFYLYIRLSENMELNYKNIIYETEFELIDNHMKDKEDVMLEFRRMKHDLKHQMIELLDFLQNGEYDKLEETIKELAEMRTMDGIGISNTNNSLIDAFVNYKYETAIKNGIQFNIKMNIPSHIPFNNSDLCIVLGNALDNAIEANMRDRLPQSFINLKTNYDGDNLIIIVENSFDGRIIKNRIGETITRKQDMINHGLGINSIKKILEKYHGYYDVSVNENVYCLRMILHGNTT